MKKSFLYSVLVLLFIFTGCSQKDVEIDSSEEVINTSGNQTSKEKSVIDSEQTSENNLDKIDEVTTQSEEIVEKVTTEVEKEVFNPILFAFDKFNLSEDMLSIARKNSSKLLTLGSNTNVKLEGNCDEWGSDEYNYALGLKRAKTVKDILIADGLNTQVISMVSFGESNPTCTEHNEGCWTQNRRVEYKVMQ